MCNKHVDWYQQNKRISILGTDDLTSAEVMESEDDRQLVENIQELLGEFKNSWFFLRWYKKGKYMGPSCNNSYVQSLLIIIENILGKQFQNIFMLTRLVLSMYGPKRR